MENMDSSMMEKEHQELAGKILANVRLPLWERMQQINNLLYENGYAYYTGMITRYEFPYTGGAFLSLSCIDGVLSAKLTAGKHSARMVYSSYPKFRETCEKMEKCMEMLHLSLFPEEYTPEFKQCVLTAQEGDFLDFRSGISLLCTKRDENGIVFQKCYEGDIRSLTLEDFQNGETFTVRNGNTKSLDLQYLYGKAYSSCTRNVAIDISKQGSDTGFYHVTKIEESLRLGEMKSVHVGPLTFVALRDDKRHVTWYGADGRKIDRKEAAMVFGWAHRQVPEFTVAASCGDEYLPVPLPDDFSTAYLSDIEKAARSGNLEETVKLAFEYSKLYQSMFSISMDGLFEGKEGNFDRMSFIFDGETGKILCLNFEGTTGSPYPETIEEVSEKEFLDILRMRMEMAGHEQFLEGTKDSVSRKRSLLGLSKGSLNALPEQAYRLAAQYLGKPDAGQEPDREEEQD
jgi:hypothetical protein